MHIMLWFYVYVQTPAVDEANFELSETENTQPPVSS